MENLSFDIKYPNIKRKYGEPEHSYRTEFMRDRDRIMYSKAFRRLSGKTQIFFSAFNDHARTRLTHSIEVAQLSRVAASQLNLNVDLSEAIALGHDLGHTPFGHAGEKTLRKMMSGCSKFTYDIIFNSPAAAGFKHNLQCLRVAIVLEKELNLTNYTLFGMCYHTGLDWKKLETCSNYDNEEQKCRILNRPCLNKGIPRVSFYDNLLDDADLDISNAWSFEAFLVKICDEIAQRHHDIEDSIVAKIIPNSELYRKLKIMLVPIFGKENFPTEEESETPLFKQNISRYIIDGYMTDLINTTKNNLSDLSSLNHNIRMEEAQKLVCFSSELRDADKRIQRFLKDSVILSYPVQRMNARADYVLRQLFEAYLTNPSQLPNKCIYSLYESYKGDIKPYNQYTQDDLQTEVAKYRTQIANDYNNKDFKVALIRIICDYIAGMTDNFAENEYHKLYGITKNPY